MKLTPAALLAKWNIRFATNDTFEIDEADLREFTQDLVDSLGASKFAQLTDDPLTNLKLAAYLADKLSLTEPGLQTVVGPVEFANNGYPLRIEDGDLLVSANTYVYCENASQQVVSGFNLRPDGITEFLSDIGPAVVQAGDFRTTNVGIDASINTFNKLAGAFWAIVKGAPGALDTLKEIADQLASDESGAAAMLATIQQHTQQLAQKVGVYGQEAIYGQKTFASPISIAVYDSNYQVQAVLQNTAGGASAQVGLDMLDYTSTGRGGLRYWGPAWTRPEDRNMTALVGSGNETLAIYANANGGKPADIQFKNTSGAAVSGIIKGDTRFWGIGTATPQYQLDVNGTINAKKILVNGAELTSSGQSTPSNTST